MAAQRALHGDVALEAGMLVGGEPPSHPHVAHEVEVAALLEEPIGVGVGMVFAHPVVLLLVPGVEVGADVYVVARTAALGECAPHTGQGGELAEVVGVLMDVSHGVDGVR